MVKEYSLLVILHRKSVRLSLSVGYVQLRDPSSHYPVLQLAGSQRTSPSRLKHIPPPSHWRHMAGRYMLLVSHQSDMLRFTRHITQAQNPCWPMESGRTESNFGTNCTTIYCYRKSPWTARMDTQTTQYTLQECCANQNKCTSYEPYRNKTPIIVKHYNKYLNMTSICANLLYLLDDNIDFKHYCIH